MFGKNAQNIWLTSLAVSRVTGAHALKVGFTNNWASTANTADTNASNMSYRFNNGVPNQLTMHGTPTRRHDAGQGGPRRVRAGSLDATSG